MPSLLIHTLQNRLYHTSYQYIFTIYKSAWHTIWSIIPKNYPQKKEDIVNNVLYIYIEGGFNMENLGLKLIDAAKKMM